MHVRSGRLDGHVTTDHALRVHANALAHRRPDWPGCRRAVLGHPVPQSSGGGRFSLGHARGAGIASSSESLYNAAAALSPARGVLRAALCAHADGSGGWAVFRDQFGDPGVWVDPPELYAAIHFPGVSLLVVVADSAMDAAGHGHGVFPAVDRDLVGQAAKCDSGGHQSHHMARSRGRFSLTGSEPAGDATLATIMAGANVVLRALCAFPGVSGAGFVPRDCTAGGPRHGTTAGSSPDAPKVVLRYFHFVADPQDPAGDSGHGFSKLGACLDSLVYDAHQHDPGGAVGRFVDLPSHAVRSAAATTRARRVKVRDPRRPVGAYAVFFRVFSSLSLEYKKLALASGRPRYDGAVQKQIVLTPLLSGRSHRRMGSGTGEYSTQRLKDRLELPEGSFHWV